jgi:TonB family protein
MAAQSKERTYGDADVKARLARELPKWRLEGGHIRRKYETHSWKGTLMVINAVGHLAEAAWHHPEITASYAWVEVALQNHAAGGITDKDFELAKKIEPPMPPVETPPLAETPPAQTDVVLPPPRPPQRTAEPKHRRKLADLNSAPPKIEHSATRAVAPAPGAASHDPNAVPQWKTALVTRLERYKRYPSEAQARGDEGVAQLAFTVDRSGGVHNARIVRSSGSSLLDRATLDLIARAQPLPAPPPDIRGSQIAIVVPINYNLRKTR